jgi:polar amino acid transport system ATP-binding protein
MAILEVRNVGKSFGSTEVLKDISFSLEKGESLAIIGSSGNGKTTLLRCLNFLETPDSGIIKVNDEVIFDGKKAGSVSNAELRRKRLHFGLVFQSFNLFPQYTAFQNVTLAGELLAKERPDYKANKKQIIEEIRGKGKALLDSVGLAAKADNYPHQLSGGQQQRVAIARALALNPDILCFDEPTSALDPELTGEVLNVIRSLASRKTTMIIVTHEMQFARQVADNVLFMDRGLVVEYGAPADVIDNPKNERTRKFLENYNNT